MVKYPGGTPGRWEKVACDMGRSVKDVSTICRIISVRIRTVQTIPTVPLPTCTGVLTMQTLSTYAGVYNYTYGAFTPAIIFGNYSSWWMQKSR